jgi:hypothetical protein
MRTHNLALLDSLLSGDDEWFHSVVADAKPKVKKPSTDPLVEKFEEVCAFFDNHGRAPNPESEDLRESNLGARLSGFIRNTEQTSKLLAHDRHGLLRAVKQDTLPAPVFNEPALGCGEPTSIDDLLDDPLFSGGDSIITSPRAQRSSLLSRERDVWARQPCQDFARFKHKFDDIIMGLEDGSLVRAPMVKGANVAPGDVFSWKGTLCFIEKEASLDDDDKDGRVRVIFANELESWMKEASITRHFYALRYRGEQRAYVERIIPKSEAQPDNLPDEEKRDPDVTGYIYVARTLSKHPSIAPYKDGMVKIGVTSGSVKKRIAGAENDPTFLLSKAKIVATFTLKKLDHKKVERLIHEHFSDCQLDIQIKDRFGKSVSANEWFATTPELVATFISSAIK